MFKQLSNIWITYSIILSLWLLYVENIILIITEKLDSVIYLNLKLLILSLKNDYCNKNFMIWVMSIQIRVQLCKYAYVYVCFIVKMSGPESVK